MHTKVQKWGNSLAVRLPAELAQQLSITAGTSVRFTKKANSLEITSENPKKITVETSAYRLKDLIDQITPHNTHEAVDWGRPVGKELW